MADRSKSRKYPQKIYPQNAEETSNLLQRVEPLITPALLKSRYLHGIDITDYSEDEIKQEIWLAVNEIELLLNVPVFPVQMEERHPYDYSHYSNYFHFKTNRRPILSVEEAAVKSSNGQTVYRFPLQWLDMGYAYRGQINFLPLLSVFASGEAGIASGDPNGSAMFLQAMMYNRWIPGFYNLKYTAGLCKDEGSVPIIVNDLIGLSTATEILSAKQAQITHSSQSLGQDGISQSSSMKGGGDVYSSRIEMLSQRRERMLSRMKALLFNKYFIANI